MPGIYHTKVATKPNNPNREISTDAWNQIHVISDNSIPLTKLTNWVIPSTPPTGKKKIINMYWDDDTQEVVIEYEG